MFLVSLLVGDCYQFHTLLMLQMIEMKGKKILNKNISQYQYRDLEINN